MGTFHHPHAVPALCRFCGHEGELVNDSILNDDYCQKCGGWQNENYKVINYLGHRWFVLFVDGNGYSHLARMFWRNSLKIHGQVDRIIEAKLGED
jgi:hypothetical protein